eukprot:UN00082
MKMNKKKNCFMLFDFLIKYFTLDINFNFPELYAFIQKIIK